METRKCSNCAQWLTQEAFAPAKWKAQPHHNVACRECISLKERAKVKPVTGYIYVVSNEAWPEWCKVGMSANQGGRVAAYNTGSPFRDYVLHYEKLFEDMREAERAVHTALSQEYEQRNEWFRVSIDTAIKIVEEA